MIVSAIEAIKIVRKATFPQLSLVNAKRLIEKCYPQTYGQGFSAMSVNNIADLEPLFNLCLAYNQKVFIFSESHEILWGERPFVSDESLLDIAQNPNRYIDQRK